MIPDDLNVIAEAFKTLRESMIKLSDDGLENDKALLRVCEAAAQRMAYSEEYVQLLVTRIISLEKKVMDLSEKIEMLHELYHTHFNDDVTRH